MNIRQECKKKNHRDVCVWVCGCPFVVLYRGKRLLIKCACIDDFCTGNILRYLDVLYGKKVIIRKICRSRYLFQIYDVRCVHNTNDAMRWCSLYVYSIPSSREPNVGSIFLFSFLSLFHFLLKLSLWVDGDSSGEVANRRRRPIVNLSCCEFIKGALHAPVRMRNVCLVFAKLKFNVLSRIQHREGTHTHERQRVRAFVASQFTEHWTSSSRALIQIRSHFSFCSSSRSLSLSLFPFSHAQNL